MPKSENPCMKIFVLLIILITIMKLPKMLNCNNKRVRLSNHAKYTVYGYMGCPYTVKQLDDFKQNNIKFKFVNTNTAQGSAEFARINEGESGVPLTLDVTSGKKYHGFTESSRM
jgi:hypothetical protein